MTIITALQRELTALQQQFASMKAGKPAPVTDLDRVFDAVRKAGKPMTYAEIEKATGLTQSTINTLARKLAYQRRIWLALEPGPGQRLVFVCRRCEDVEVADRLAKGNAGKVTAPGGKA